MGEIDQKIRGNIMHLAIIIFPRVPVVLFCTKLTIVIAPQISFVS